MGVKGLNCAVTGGSGFVGQRLVEMLIERGANKVISFDIAPKPEDASEDPRIVYIQGDITKKEDVSNALKGGIDCVWHVAAAVGPFLPAPMYNAVNYRGTIHVLDACREHKIPKLVMSSSPSTRFDGNDVIGLREENMSIRPPGQFMQAYAETKAMGEVAVRNACCDELMTVAIAPHQVYGPRDCLFLSSILSAAKSGKLRILGDGKNMISFTHVDNYCHGLILGYDALYKGSPALGQYYNVTDDGKYNFYDCLDQAVVALGYTSLKDKFAVPTFIVKLIAYLLLVVTFFTGIRYKLNPFTAKAMTMHRWFDITNAKRDLKYAPIIPFEQGWADTIEWFKPREEWWQRMADRAERSDSNFMNTSTTSTSQHATTNTTITFECKCNHLLANETLAVVGDSCLLGNWDPIKGVAMTMYAKDSYKVTVATDRLEHVNHLEYKYVKKVCDGDKPGSVTWMEGPNMVIEGNQKEHHAFNWMN